MGDDCEIQAVQSLEDKNRYFFWLRKEDKFTNEWNRPINRDENIERIKTESRHRCRTEKKNRKKQNKI